MSAAISNPGILGRFLSIFRTKDPVKKELVQSVTIIDKLLRSLEISKKNLEAIAEEHKKKMRAQGEDRELAKILDEEVRNIYGYLSMLTKTVYDLTRVKYRLETLFYVEEPLKVIPEVLEELRAIEPNIEKINPQLVNHVRALEQKVASIISMSSSYFPGIISAPLVGSTADQRSQQPSHSAKQHVQAVEPTTSGPPPTSLKGRGGPSTTSQQQKKEEGPVQVPIPQGSDRKQGVPAPQQAGPQTGFSVPLHVVEQWLLNELKVTAGILDLSVFEKKYGVPRHVILEALSSLESKNVVRVRRK